ncbi:hypothetical protein ACFR9U_16855 [Halorientalis brevis]|uniref:Zinc ribbon domain-containing protein n=1 Tax=Halorientalis brevis TaxID=1126241 RepID=A0ABD6CEP2_9EURY|nr:hypothetical protein [Halorientalis brevis]
MAAFASYDCANCGKTFRAHTAGNAAANAYCSPQCESDGKEL